MASAHNSFLHDPVGQGLLGLAARRCLTWGDFLQVQLPADTDAAEAWDVLNGFNKTLSMRIPITDFDGLQWWYRRTCEIDDAVQEIVAACSVGSPLHRAIQQTEGQHFVMKMRIEETIAAAQLDGLAISSSDAQCLLRLDRTPRTTPEQLMSNTMVVMGRIPELASEPFTPTLLRRIRTMLLENVDLRGLTSTPLPQGTIIGEYSPDLAIRYAERQLRDICAYLNYETADSIDLPTLMGPAAADCLCFYRPLGDVSGQVGRIVHQLHAVKSGLPVLALLPISKTKLDWENGKELPGVPFDRQELNALSQRVHGDATGYQTIAAKLILATVRDAMRYADEWQARDAQMRDILRDEPFLNHRQRSILARGLRVSNAEFRIKYHQVNHNIAYPTARRDLLELETQGYLTMTQKGKAFVFQPGPRLRELVAQRPRVVHAAR